MDIDKLRALLDDIELAALTEQANYEMHVGANQHEAMLAQGWASRFNQWARRLKEAIEAE